MKRIETVITPWSLDTFKELAPKLGISEFNLVEIYSTCSTTAERRKRLYKGAEYTTDLVPRLKLEFVLLDDDVKATLHQLLVSIRPESIAVFKLDQTLRTADQTSLPGLFNIAADLPSIPSTGRIRDSVPRGCNSSDQRRVALRNAADDSDNRKVR